MADPAESRQRVAIGLVWNAGALLVGRRGDDGPLPGFAEFPGGKCLSDESPEAAVVRECLEETGLAVVVAALRSRVACDYSHATVDLFFFDCVAMGVDDIAPHPPFEWKKLSQIAELRFPPANDEVIRSALDRPFVDGRG